ncbi:MULTISPECIES: hypothetical protein [Haloferax]|uniref:DUF7345 domain-containing protein n=2 Tax=Haloferax TaxID=2251 RepID=A0A6G1Z4I8_9EURY|nr:MULTISPECIES: hypothetical protein [Haloferax]KAB1188529.1 hypothetical protein Hfx1149_10980 [Haloferax sp. CBA1149]MRW81224.1 hypothetical protein [Haloferax marinisediminis]
MSPDGRTRTICLLVAGLVVATALTGSVTALSSSTGTGQHDAVDSRTGLSSTVVSNDTSAFVVALSPNGSARVTLRLTYDLTAEEERAGFERLEANASEFATSYATRLKPLAARASNETGREMAIRDQTAQFSELGSTGVVELSVTWTNVATHRDGRIVLAEPFDTGFNPDRPFVVRAPEGYELASASPSPNVRSPSEVAWNTSEQLDGVSVAFETTESGEDQSTGTTTSSTEMPVGAAPVLAVLGVMGLFAVRGRRRG